MKVSSTSSNEHWFYSVIRNSTDIIAIIDAHGNYTYVSPSCFLELGYDASFFIGKNAFEFIHPDDAEHLLSILQNIHEVGELELPHYRILDARHNYRWIQSRIT
ncbi:MAG TPA: PAS domain-containing protein, partial [Oculatellaceae cyanobacterium]